MTTPTQSPKRTLNADASPTLVAESTVTAPAATIVASTSAAVAPAAVSTPTDSKNATTASVTVTTVPTSTTVTPISVTAAAIDDKSTTVTARTTPSANTAATKTVTTVTAATPDNKSAAELKAIVATAKEHESKDEFADAIRCYRNALFVNPAEKSILINIEAIQKKLTNKTADKNKIKYYIACAKARASTTNSDQFAITLAEAIIRTAFENKIPAAEILQFLEADVNAKVFTTDDTDKIRQHFLTALVPVVSQLKDPVNQLADNKDAHLLDALKKYGAQLTVEFLAASAAWDVKQKFPVLVRTFFQIDLLKNQTLRNEFIGAIVATFTKLEDKKSILDEIKRQFNQLAAAQIDEYRNKSYRDKERRGKKANAIEAINNALQAKNTDFSHVLALVEIYQKDTKVVMGGTTTAVLLNSLEFALETFGYTASVLNVEDAPVDAVKAELDSVLLNKKLLPAADIQLITEYVSASATVAVTPATSSTAAAGIAPDVAATNATARKKSVIVEAAPPKPIVIRDEAIKNLRAALDYTLEQKWTVGVKPKFTTRPLHTIPVTAATTPTVDSTTTASSDSKITAPLADGKTAVYYVYEIDNAKPENFNAAGLLCENAEITLNHHSPLIALTAQAWKNAADSYHREDNLAKALKCCRSAFLAADAKSKDLLVKQKEQILQQIKAKKLDTNETKYLTAFFAAYDKKRDEIDSKKFATELFTIISPSDKTIFEDLEKCLQSDVNLKVLNQREKSEIHAELLKKLAPNQDLSESIAKYGIENTFSILTAVASNNLNKVLAGTVSGKLFSGTLFKNYGYVSANELDRERKLREEFLTVLKSAKYSIPAIAEEVRNQFNAKASEQRDAYKKEGNTAKADALQAVLNAANFPDMLAVISQQKANAAVMKGKVTAGLLKDLERVLTLLGYVATAPVAKADIKADAKADVKADVTATAAAVNPGTAVETERTADSKSSGLVYSAAAAQISAAMDKAIPQARAEIEKQQKAENSKQKPVVISQDEASKTTQLADQEKLKLGAEEKAAHLKTSTNNTTTASAVASDAASVLPPVVTANSATATVAAPVVLTTPVAGIGGVASTAKPYVTPFLYFLKR